MSYSPNYGTRNDSYSPPFSEGRPRSAESASVKVCRYCGADPVARTATPEGQNATDYHGTAKCVEGDEPSYKMGGPA